MKVKYVRYSSVTQSGARQLLDSEKFDQVVLEQISGAIAFAKRPKAAQVLKWITQGKVTDLYVEGFSRLGRNAYDTLSTLHFCEEHGVNVHIQNMSLSSRGVNGKPNPMFKMFSHIVSVVAEQERELLLERTAMGRIAAQQAGVVFGRKAGSNERKVDFIAKESSKKILKYLQTGQYTVREIAKLTDSSTTTVLKVKRVAVETKVMKAA